MKKAIAILVLGLLWCCNVYSDVVYLPKDIDVFSGEKFRESTNSKENKRYPEHAWKIVNKKDGHPVRAGEKSIRIEVRAGDCYTRHDCRTHRERIEFTGDYKFKGEWWYAWSIYLQEDYINLNPIGVMLVQFKQDKKYGHPEESPPYWAFENSGSDGGNRIPEGYWINNRVNVPAGAIFQLLTDEEMLGKWNDLLVNVKWTEKEDGFFKVWVNNELKFDFKGPTKRKPPVRFKFGNYRRLIFIDNTPTQVVYYDEIRVGKTREKVTRFLDK